MAPAVITSRSARIRPGLALIRPDQREVIAILPFSGARSFRGEPNLLKTASAGTSVKVKRVEKTIARAPKTPKIRNGSKLVAVIDKSPTPVEIVVKLIGQIIGVNTLRVRSVTGSSGECRVSAK